MNIKSFFSKILVMVKHNIDVLSVGLLMLFIFFRIMFFGYARSDLPAHAGIARIMLENHRLFLGNFLMYFCVNLCSGFSGSIRLTKIVLAFFISAANTVKYVVVRKAFGNFCPLRIAKLSSFALLFVFVIPILLFLKLLGLYNGFLYFPGCMGLGCYIPNVWHNSTLLCMMPFAIMTYLLSIKQFDSFDGKRNLYISLLVVIGVLIKPSFFLIWTVAFPIVMFIKCHSKKDFYYSLIPVLFGCICLLYEYVTIFFSPPIVPPIDPKDADTSVVISIRELFFAEFWNSCYPFLIVSFLFPVIFVVAYWKVVLNDYEFWFVLVMLVVALGVSWCCHETGARHDHGNFAWQVICSLWFVFYYILKIVMRFDVSNDLGRVRVTNRGKVFLSVYGLHVIIGLWYLVGYLLSGNYWDLLI